MTELGAEMQHLSNFHIEIASGKVAAGLQSHEHEAVSCWIQEDQASGKHLGDANDRSS